MVEKDKARIIEKVVILVLRMVNLFSTSDTENANIIPTIPPTTPRTTLSVKNC